MKKIKIKVHSDKIFAYLAMFSMVANILSPFAALIPSAAYAEDVPAEQTTEAPEEKSSEPEEESAPEEEQKEEAPAEEPAEEKSTEEPSTEETQEPTQEETTEPEAVVESSNEIPADIFTIDSEVITEEIPAEITPEEPEESLPIEEQPNILPDGASDYRPGADITGSEVTEVQEVVDPVVTEEPVKEYETLADGAEIKDSSSEDWNVDGEKAETKELVKIGIKYIFPLEEEVSITFTKLPKSDEDRSKLKIERVKVSDLNLPDDFNTDAEYAFDITTDMENGEFEYDITLPKPENREVEVSYIEKSVEEVKNEIEFDDIKQVEENKIEQKSEDLDVKVSDLNHFTIFIVVFNPANADNDTSIGAFSWTGTGNVYSSDNSRASISLGKNNVSYYLKATNFSSTVPANAIINGIQVEFERNGSNKIKDNSIKIVKNGVIGGNEKSSGSSWTGTEGYFSYGGSNDDWGLSWTAADINNTNTGVAISIKHDNSTGSITSYIDHIKMTVYYSTNVAPEITEGLSADVSMSENGTPTPFSLTLHATDADVEQTLTWSISSVAGHGTATASGTGVSKVITYTPTHGYVGSDSFIVQVSDGKGGIDTITVNVSVEAVPLFTPPTLTYNPSDNYALTSVSGIWTDVDGGGNVNGEDTEEVRWGHPAGLDQSGMRFDGSGQQSFNEGDGFYLGALTHFNWPITNAADGATLKITLQFLKPGISLNPEFTFDFDIDETTNEHRVSDCDSGWQQTSTPCDDKVTFPSVYGEESFTIGDKLYTLKINGFVNAFPGGSLVSEFITEEQKNNTAFLVGSLSSVLVDAPQITLVEKAVNDEDADVSPGETLYVGDATAFTYQVQNTGNVDLTDVVVHDDDSTLTISCPSTSLSSGSSMTCTATSTVKLGNYHNTAYVTAKRGATSLTSNNEESYYTGINKIMCGDGIFDSATEECDDGNAVDDDACSNSCTVNHRRITLCHATPVNTAANGFNAITIDDDGVFGDAHDSNHGADIIPAFSYYKNGLLTSYPGKNLVTVFFGLTGQTILNNGCKIDSTLVVQKTTFPSGDETNFDISISTTNGTVSGSTSGTITDATDNSYTVSEGTYSITETVPTGWGLTSNGCLNVQVGVGETKYCTIVNKKLPVLTVEKVLVGNTTLFSNFSFVLDGWSTSQFEADGSNDILIVPDQAYAITEVNPGSSYNVSYSAGCNGTLTYEQSATCTITNTQSGSITIIKDAQPDGAQSFSFTDTSSVPVVPGPFVDDNNGDESERGTYTSLPSGTYVFTEDSVDGWFVGSISCTEDVTTNSTTDVNNRKVTINLDAGENVTCTFTNIQKGSIWGSKYNDLNSSGNRDTLVGSDNTEPGLPGWTITLKDSSGAVVDSMQTDSKGDYWFNGLIPGDYTVCETQQIGWLNTDPSASLCKQVTLGSGQSTNINFGNKQNPVTIKAYKVVCDDEFYLPDWGLEPGGPSITADTAQTWVDKSNGHCRLEPNWNFQWSYDGVGNPGDNIIGGAGAGWNTFGATTEITQLDTPKLWFREVLQDGYIPFTYVTGHLNNSDNVSAEFYCNNDVLNYDNWEWIDNPQFGQTYHCVAWNVLKTGDLEVTKTVDWVGITPDTSEKFEICITGPSPSTNKDCKEADYDGETLTWSNLQLGDYTITESDPGVLWTVVGSGSVVTVGFNTTVTHEVKNTYIASCGDGVKNQESEQCDGEDGVATDGSEFCTSKCKLVPIYDGNHECPRGTVEKYVAGITLDSRSDTFQGLNLLGGKSYLLRAYGTYQFGDGSQRKADPAYGSEDDFITWRPDIGIWGVNNRGVTSIIGNLGRGVGVIEWDDDKNIDGDHTYEKLIRPDSDLDAQFVISDWYGDWYGNNCDNQNCMRDNNGSLNLDLYECVIPGSIQGKKFKDVNANGVRNGGGDTYLDGWTIKLYKQGAGWNWVKSMVTGGGTTEAGLVDPGQYRFTNLVPGKYLVCEELKTGWMQTKPSSGPIQEGSFCHEVDLIAGEQENGLTFGNFELGKVQGMKFNDLDGDGNAHESGEDFMNGLTLRLYKDWVLQGEVTTSNTGTLGQYRFESLEPGTYQVCEVLQSGWTQKWPSVGNIPVDDNGVTHSAYGTAVTNSLGTGDEGSTCWQTVISASGQLNQLLRFGNSNLGSVSGMKYIDYNGDGDYDDGSDWKGNGWTINLYKLVVNDGGAYTFVTSTSTDSNGNYSFTNLEQGTYKIEEVQWPDYIAINPLTGIYEGVVVNPGNNLNGYDFGNFQKGSVYGCKYNDLNGNGTREREFEPQMGGWTINLYDSNWGLVGQTVTTEGFGYGNNYSFNYLLGKGTYYICEVMWPGWIQTEPFSESGGIMINASQNAANEGMYCRRIDNNYSGNGYSSQRFGNAFVNPELRISKENDIPLGETRMIGDIVTFIIRLRVLGSSLKNVLVTDLLPKGFKFITGSSNWSVVSNDHGTLTPPDPTYASPGTWDIGGLDKDEEITITYKAEIQSEVDPGVYRDLAMTMGEDILSRKVAGLSETPGDISTYFVGTEVKVEEDAPVKDSVDVEETEEEEEEVLGASDERLPATGASTTIVRIVLITGFVGGLLMTIGGIGQMIKDKNKKDKNTRMKKALLTMLALGFSLILTSRVYANGIDPKLVARIEAPESPAITSFNLNFVVLDANETLRTIEAQCWKKGPLDADFVKFADPAVDGTGGNTNNCLVDSSVLTQSGTYEFKIMVRADANPWQDSINSESIEYDNEGPDRPKYIEKDKKSDCKYELTVKTADDGQTSSIKIYRDDSKDMNLHSGNLIETKTIGPDEKYEFDYEVYGGDCGKTWYFAVIAFDDSGNASDPRAEEVVTTVTVTKTETTEEVLGALEVPGGANIPGEGEIAGEETTTETGGGTEGGSVLGEETQEQGFGTKMIKSPWFWLILVVLAYITARVIKNKNKKK